LGDESDEDVYQPIYFDQTSKFQGSMVNRNMFSMDGEFVGKIKDSGPDYSI
jgi:cytoskeletal protein CcmA (bactofilin family)